MARYLRGSCYTPNKTHWIKWERVCLLIEEGGLGIRCLKDVVEAFSIKMWWRFREQETLWAAYMFQKFCSQSYPLVLYCSSRFSPMWRRMFKAGMRYNDLFVWSLGEGKIDFWHDIWLADVPLAGLWDPNLVPRSQRVSDFWEGDTWYEEGLWRLYEEKGLPAEIIEEILMTPFDRGEKDSARWKPSPNGNFSLASKWELVRLPVDTKLQWRGVELASKCRCCGQAEIESRLHLFVNEEAARYVWLYFAQWFPQIPAFAVIGRNIEVRIRWWQRHMNMGKKQHICSLIPCLILWFIWTERNDCIHRGKPFEVENIIKRIIVYLRNLVVAGLMGPEQWSGCCPKVDFMEACTFGARPRKVGRLQWRPPDALWLKVNTDGAFSQGPRGAGGGGVIRDHKGEIVAAFASVLEAATSLETEVAAILEGVTFAKRFGNCIHIESDTDLVVGWLRMGQLGPVSVRHNMVRIRKELKDVEWRVSHIFREGNKVADFLANWGSRQVSCIQFTKDSAPARVKALCRLDQLGLPSFRF